MARIVVIGAGMSGHATALGLRHRLSEEHQVIVITPNTRWMNPDTLAHIAVGSAEAATETVALGSLYKNKGIIFHQGVVTAIYPEGYRDDKRPQVAMTFSSTYRKGQTARVPFDYLVIATGHDIDRVAGIPATGATVPTCVIDRLDSAVAGEIVVRRLISELQDSPSSANPKVIAVGRAFSGMRGYFGALEYVLSLDRILRFAFLRERVALHFFDAGRPWLFLPIENLEIESELRTEIDSLLQSHGIINHRNERLVSINANRVRFASVDEDVAQPGELQCDLVAVEASRVLTPLPVLSPTGADLSAALYDDWGRIKTDAKRTEDERGKVFTTMPRTFKNSQYPRIYGIGSAIALDADDSADEGRVPSPMQTRDMAHLMSREVTEQIVLDITGDAKKSPPEIIEDINSVVSLFWGSSVLSKNGYFAELAYQKPKSGDNGKIQQYLRVRRGWRASLTVRQERFVERYRAKARPLWWLLPS